MYGVTHARRVRRIVTAREAEVVVAQVADHVGDNEPGQHGDEIAPCKDADVGGEERGNNGGLGRNDQNDAACGLEKQRHAIESSGVLRTRLVEADKGAPPQLGLQYGHARFCPNSIRKSADISAGY